MRKPLVILVLLVAFNFTAPDSSLLSIRQRHLIEYAQESHTKSVPDGEVVKNKAVIYLKLIIMMSEMERIEKKNGLAFNTS